MQRIPPERIQPLLLDILKAFSAYCQSNGISYFLYSGTLLGAVRHNGFIPWDDDIDIGMTWREYVKLLKLAKKDPYLDKRRRYRVLLPVELPNIYPFVKVVDEWTVAYERNIDRSYGTSLWIDVFSFTGYPESERDAARFCRAFNRTKNFNKIMICGDIQDSNLRVFYFFARAARLFLRMQSSDDLRFARKITEMQRVNLESPTLVGDLCWAPGMEKRFPAEYFEQTVPVEFEGASYPAPIGYEVCLTRLYGDYMQLPPEEQRQRHDVEAYVRVPEVAKEVLGA